MRFRSHYSAISLLLSYLLYKKNTYYINTAFKRLHTTKSQEAQGDHF